MFGIGVGEDSWSPSISSSETLWCSAHSVFAGSVCTAADGFEYLQPDLQSCSSFWGISCRRRVWRKTFAFLSSQLDLLIGSFCSKTFRMWRQNVSFVCCLLLTLPLYSPGTLGRQRNLILWDLGPRYCAVVREQSFFLSPCFVLKSSLPAFRSCCFSSGEG